MKIYFILLLSLLAFAAQAEEQTTETDPCEIGYGYQPQSKDIIDAVDVLNMKMIISACVLREDIKLEKSQYIQLLGFSRIENGNYFKYEITTFKNSSSLKDSIVTMRICEVSSRYEWLGDENNMAGFKEIFETPKCSKDTIVK